MNNDLIQVDGKFYKKCKVVMLATKEKSRLSTTNQNANIQLGLQYFEDYYEVDRMHDNQHLYILSDEEIKENMWDKYPIGTWYYSTVLNEIKQLQPKEKAYDPSGFIIIATTDSSLTELGQTEKGFNIYSDVLPRPSNAFIQKYVEEYNKSNVITEVLVEYEIYDDPNFVIDEAKQLTPSILNKLKTAPDNTITIKAVIETWDDIRDRYENSDYENFEFMKFLKENYQVPKKK